MFSRVSVSMRAAGLVMVGCLALGVLLGLIVPKEQRANSPENMLRGTVERRLVNDQELAAKVQPAGFQPAEEERAVLKQDFIPAGQASPASIVWPGEDKTAMKGTGLWGSDEDEMWGVNHMWSKYQFGKVFTDGLADDAYLSYPITNALSFPWGPLTDDGFSYSPTTSSFSVPFTDDISFPFTDDLSY